MTVDLYLAFVAATVVLMMIPGPNVALIVATTIASGLRHGLLTVAGTSSAMVLQLALVGWGVTGLLERAAWSFGWLRLAGAAYLIGLGIMQWRAGAARPAPSAKPPATRAKTISRAFLVSLTNPKTLFFYGAFFPQFVEPTAAPEPQVVLLAATFLAIAVVLDGLWAVAASRMRRLPLFDSGLANRISGGLLVGAGAGLALSRSR